MAINDEILGRPFHPCPSRYFLNFLYEVHEVQRIECSLTPINSKYQWYLNNCIGEDFYTKKNTNCLRSTKTQKYKQG